MTNYGATDGLCEPLQEIMEELGGTTTVKRIINPIELFGIEGKNNYELYSGKGTDSGMAGAVAEESGCCERICCGSGRSLTLTAHRHNKTGPLALEVRKAQHLVLCPCCSRPHAQVVDGRGRRLGAIEDPFSCCNFNHDVVDANGQKKFRVEGTCCQTGHLCPCCADVDLQILGPRGDEVGTMTRLALTCAELYCPSNRFRVKFPKGASTTDKALLLASQLMMDVTYFDQANSSNGGGSN